MKETSMKKRKTALVLGGGGSRGAYEIGVWQALRELGIKIDMVFGTSVGSINGALIVQDDFDVAVKLWREITTNMIFDIDLPEPKKSEKSPKAKLIENVKERIAERAGFSIDEAKAYAKEIIKNGGASAGGLSALLNSIAKADPNGIGCGSTVTNLMIDEQLIKNDEYFEKMTDLLETYFKNGGVHFQLTYVSREDLLHAKETPEDYKSLRVRVSGFSDYFVKLNETLQDDIIERTTQK